MPPTNRHDLDHYLRELVRIGIVLRERHHRRERATPIGTSRLQPEDAALLRAALDDLRRGTKRT